MPSLFASSMTRCLYLSRALSSSLFLRSSFCCSVLFAFSREYPFACFAYCSVSILWRSTSEMSLTLEFESRESLGKNDAGADLLLPKDELAEEMKEGTIGCETALSALDPDSEGGGDTVGRAFDFRGCRSCLGTLDGPGLSFTGSVFARGACCKAWAASCLFQRALSRDSLANFSRRSSASSRSAL